MGRREKYILTTNQLVNRKGFGKFAKYLQARIVVNKLRSFIMRRYFYQHLAPFYINKPCLESDNPGVVGCRDGWSYF